jgi:hypothetical protein
MNIDLNTPVAYDAEAKARFLRYCQKQLSALAKELGLPPDSYDLRVNPGGIAVSGEATLHSNTLYIQASQSSLGPNFGILIRSCKGRRDYTGGPNNHVHIDLLRSPEVLAENIRRMRLHG